MAVKISDCFNCDICRSNGRCSSRRKAKFVARLVLADKRRIFFHQSNKNRGEHAKNLSAESAMKTVRGFKALVKT